MINSFIKLKKNSYFKINKILINLKKKLKEY